MSIIKQPILKLFCCLLIIISFSNCATIIGGSTYYANVSVKDHPNAVIKYKGVMKGKGTATILVQRKNANKFFVDIEEEGCVAKSDTFSSRSIRPAALVGTLLGWTGIVNGVPAPWGLGLDLLTGALWKPNVNEKGVSKEDFKNLII